MIEYKGLENLNLLEQVKLKLICRRNYKKLKRDFKDLKLEIDINVYEEGDKKRRKFSLHGRILSPNLKISVTKSVDWEIPRATHKLMNNLKNKISKKKKSFPNYQKSRR